MAQAGALFIQDDAQQNGAAPFLGAAGAAGAADAFTPNRTPAAGAATPNRDQAVNAGTPAPHHRPRPHRRGNNPYRDANQGLVFVPNDNAPGGPHDQVQGAAAADPNVQQQQQQQQQQGQGRDQGGVGAIPGAAFNFMSENPGWTLLIAALGGIYWTYGRTPFVLGSAAFLAAMIRHERQQAARRAQEEREQDAQEMMQLARRMEELRQRNNFGDDKSKKS